MGLLSGLADLVFAPVCLGCGAPVMPDRPRVLVCGRCLTRLAPPPPPRCPRCSAPRVLTGRAPTPECPDCVHWDPALGRATSACLLRAPADQLVHRLKYGGWRHLAGPMTEKIARQLVRGGLAPRAGGGDVLVPVPTTPARLRTRGYNQAALLAEALAVRLSLPVVSALRRARSKGSQTSLQPSERRANVAGTFQLMAPMDRIRGRRVLLVDDVLTTGATAGECARVLTDAGAREVALATFARALDARRTDPGS